MHDTLDWRDRIVDERPVVIIHVPTNTGYDYSCMDAAVGKFLYHQGPNPFDSSLSNEGVKRIGFRYNIGILYQKTDAPMETLE